MNRGSSPASSQVVQGRIHVGAPHGFDEGGDHVVVLVAVPVVAHGGPVHRVGEHLGGDLPQPERLSGGRRLLQVGQRAASIPAGQTHQIVPGRIDQGDGARQAPFVDQRTGDQGRDVGVGQGFEPQQQRTRQQRGDHGEAGVLRGCRDQGDDPVLHRGQQRVLLGLGEAVHLVDEQHGRGTPFQLPPGRVEFGAQFPDPRGHRRELNEPGPGCVGDDGCQGGLADSRWPPQENAHRLPRDQPAERSARAEQVLLPDELVQIRRTHPDGQRRPFAAGVPQGTARPGGHGVGVAEQVRTHTNYSSGGFRAPAVSFVCS